MNLIRYTTENRIASITLNRPDKRNALNEELISELSNAFSTAAADADVKVIVLKATGKAFCAGADLDYLKRLQQHTYEENLADSQRLADLFRQIYTLDKVVIAQIQGSAVAGGCGLATVCDFAFSVPSAQFGYTEVRIGFIPAIVSWFLVRKIGETRAKELLLSGDLISAERAQQYNLIHSVVEEYELEDRVTEFARMLSEKNAAQSLSLTKQLFGQLPTLPLKEAMAYAAEMNAHARLTDDCRHGIAAFLNKEAIKW